MADSAAGNQTRSSIADDLVAHAPDAGFGASVRVPYTGFMVFGLLSFWAYTAVCLAQEMRAHFSGRWNELHPRLEAAGLPPDRIEAIRLQGYANGIVVPIAAAAMFALDGVLVVGWFWNWIVIGDVSNYRLIMAMVGASSALFYAATCLLTIWIARRLYQHERVELLIQELGPAAIQGALAPTAALVARWEQQNNHVSLFLIVAFAMVASPAVGAHLFLRGVNDNYAVWLAVACFACAALFHFWGTRLLVGLFNGHLATEAAQSRSKPVLANANSTRVGSPAPAIRAQPSAGGNALEPYDGTEPFIFVSYKRDDLPRITAALGRIRDSGYRLWYDKGIPGGAEWDALIEEKLKGCSMLLFFVSEGSVASKYCRREVKYVDQLGKPILSVKLESAELAHGMDMLLTQYQMVDAANEDFSGEIERALKYLRLF